MSNSKLATYTNISPNKNSPRNHKIDTVTIHCIVGQWTAKQGCDFFKPASRRVSANYVVGKDGSIGLCVDEADRSWCSSSPSNDNRAITIEVASDTFDPYYVTDKAMDALLNLLVDICQRNSIKELKWKADKSLIGHPEQQNMTVHRWFAQKSCPGEYLYSNHYKIAAEVNRRLAGGSPKCWHNLTDSGNKPPEQPHSRVKVGDTVVICSNATWWGKHDMIPLWVRLKQWVVKSVDGQKAVIDKSADDKNSINSAIDVKYLTVETVVPFKTRVTASVLNIRAGAGLTFPVKGSIRDHGVYTIVEVKGDWGKLKSGAGWIYLPYTKKL